MRIGRSATAAKPKSECYWPRVGQMFSIIWLARLDQWLPVTISRSLHPLHKG
jgi:hypothetical protein